MSYNNVPDDWGCYYRHCTGCGRKYHASEGGCDACEQCDECGESMDPELLVEHGMCQGCHDGRCEEYAVDVYDALDTLFIASGIGHLFMHEMEPWQVEALHSKCGENGKLRTMKQDADEGDGSWLTTDLSVDGKRVYVFSCDLGAGK